MIVWAADPPRSTVQIAPVAVFTPSLLNCAGIAAAVSQCKPVQIPVKLVSPETVQVADSVIEHYENPGPEVSKDVTE